MLTLYRLAWWLAAPLVFLATALHPKTRVRWEERWMLRVPAVEPGAIVVHAASIGEGRAAEALLEALRPARRVLLRTATSPAGFQNARGHHALSALPVDHPAIVRAWVNRLRPSLLVLVEAEIWPNLVIECARRGVPVLRVSPREGPGTQRMRRWFPEAFAVIHDVDLGPLKRAATLPNPPFELPRPLLVAGSVREGDTERLLEALDRMDEAPFLLLAPRYPDGFDRSLLEGRERVRLLDTVGELAGFYRIADAAFVGGTYDPAIGGHSPAEALAAGVPVVHGPFTSSNADSYDERCVHEPELARGIERALEMRRIEPTSAPVVPDPVLEHVLAEPPAELPYRAWMWPLDHLYRLALAPSSERDKASLVVLSVGNLASGGTGKTPVVRHLLQELRALGRTPAVVSRGWKGGDELKMLAGEAIVVANADRVAGVAEAAEQGADVVVLDDGFHASIARDLDILVVDGVHPTAGGPIPIGEARPGRFEQADLVWCTRGDHPADIRSRVVLEDVPTGPVHAFAGIHRAGRFLEALVHAGVDVRGWTAWPDHHRFEPGEVVSDLPLVTTEKDAVRFCGEAQVVRMRIEVVDGEELLRRRLREVLELRESACSA